MCSDEPHPNPDSLETSHSTQGTGHSELGTRRSALGTLRAYFELARPANVVTAWADVLAGVAAAGVSLWPAGTESTVPEALWFILSTTGLYAGGVTLNDVFDAELDAAERPERAIPSGRASRSGAAVYGGVLLLIGVGAAARVSWLSGALAAFIAVFAVIYDRFGKHHAILGPLNMGLCRGGNLLLGASIIPSAAASFWFLALVPIAYIAGITAISRGEVHGGSSGIGWMAVGLVDFVVIALLCLGIHPGYRLPHALTFILLFGGLVLPTFFRAALTPDPASIKRAVRTGIMGLIPLNAALAAGFAGWPFGILVLLLLPLSIGLARLFAVT